SAWRCRLRRYEFASIRRVEQMRSQHFSVASASFRRWSLPDRSPLRAFATFARSHVSRLMVALASIVASVRSIAARWARSVRRCAPRGFASHFNHVHVFAVVTVRSFGVTFSWLNHVGPNHAFNRTRRYGPSTWRGPEERRVGNG